MGALDDAARIAGRAIAARWEAEGLHSDSDAEVDAYVALEALLAATQEQTCPTLVLLGPRAMSDDGFAVNAEPIAFKAIPKCRDCGMRAPWCKCGSMNYTMSESTAEPASPPPAEEAK